MAAPAAFSLAGSERIAVLRALKLGDLLCAVPALLGHPCAAGVAVAAVLAAANELLDANAAFSELAIE